MKNVNKIQVIQKIEFLETQLADLNHYLPATYEYLLGELDSQKRMLAELEVLETFQMIDSGCTQDHLDPVEAVETTGTPGQRNL